MDDFGRELLNAIENAALLSPPPPAAPDEFAAQPRRRTF
jgi:biopolymer transport protein TolQ